MIERGASADFGSSADQVGAARRFVIGVVSAWGLETGEVELVVSELASNAVQHGRSRFTVTLRCVAGRIRIEVTDFGSGVPSAGRAPQEALRGRGLMIVETLSSTWGVRFDDSSAKTVWAELNCLEARSDVPKR